jgi:hypothetical protein
MADGTSHPSIVHQPRLSSWLSPTAMSLARSTHVKRRRQSRHAARPHGRKHSRPLTGWNLPTGRTLFSSLASSAGDLWESGLHCDGRGLEGRVGLIIFRSSCIPFRTKVSFASLVTMVICTKSALGLIPWRQLAVKVQTVPIPQVGTGTSNRSNQTQCRFWCHQNTRVYGYKSPKRHYSQHVCTHFPKDLG